MKKSVEKLNLSVRASKVLVRLGVYNIEDICSKTSDELLGVTNCSITTLNEIREKLDQLGLKLEGE